MFIFKSLGLKCIPFLHQIMPPFLHLMNTCESGFREFLFQQMGSLVSVVKQRIHIAGGKERRGRGRGESAREGRDKRERGEGEGRGRESERGRGDEERRGRENRTKTT